MRHREFITLLAAQRCDRLAGGDFLPYLRHELSVPRQDRRELTLLAGRRTTSAPCAPVPSHASKGSPTYCSAKDACACSEACK
jgi:hypothetical protein